MREILVRAFAGCPTTEDLLVKLEALAEKENIRVLHEKVYRAEDAEDQELYGSPTILINEREYQEWRRGSPGVYCRTFKTAGGISEMPDIEDLLSENERKDASDASKDILQGLRYPVLLISSDCVFSRPAKNFWSKVADELGIELQVIIAEKQYELACRYDPSGYPCLICKPGARFYGFHYSHEEGKKILLQRR